MARWTTSITIYNALDRTLNVDDLQVPWGTNNGCSSQIKSGESGKLCVYSPAGAAYGVEFYATLRDLPPAGKKSYGMVNIGVDIPYGKHANCSSFNACGILKLSGYTDVKNGAHDYTTSVTISKM